MARSAPTSEDLGGFFCPPNPLRSYHVDEEAPRGDLADRGEKVIRDATHRVRSLHHTLDLAEAIEERVGISRLADITGLDTLGLPVWNTFRPLAEEHNLTVTTGKGITEDAAKASAYLEAVERYCGERQNRHGPRLPFSALAQRATTLHPTRLVLSRMSGWTSNTELEWWPTFSLTTGQTVWVPAAAVLSPYRVPPHLIAAHSDGLASGNSLAEATLHGLYELIERDATAFNETLLTGTRVIVDSLPDDAARLVEQVERERVLVGVFYLQSPTGVHVFSAIFDDVESRDGLLINSGWGCHLDPRVAVLRAITEAAQSRLCMIAGNREDLTKHGSRRDRYRTARAAAGPWLDQPERFDFRTLDDLSSATTHADLHFVVGALARAGLQTVLVADLSFDDLPFAVARTIVPGVEFFHEERDRLGARLARAIAGAA